MKKFFAILIIFPALGISACNGAESPAMTEAAVTADMWEYEYYINDIDYYSSLYSTAVARFSELVALQDWSGARAEAQSHIEILNDISEIVTPAGLAEYQNDILTAVEYEKEYRRIAVELFDCYLNGSEQGEMDAISAEFQELTSENISIETALASAREAAQAYLK